MWKFSNSNDVSTPTLVATVATTDSLMAIMMTEGWAWRRFSCITNNGGGYMPQGGVINVNVPDVVKLVQMHNEDTTDDFTEHDTSSVLSDSTVLPNAQVFLHVLALVTDKDGIPAALSANDIELMVRLKQNVMVWLQRDANLLIDEGDDAT